MENLFLVSGQIELANGGYLVKKGTTEAVYNEEFVELQKKAEWVVTYAEVLKSELAKGLSFKANKVLNLNHIDALVAGRLSNTVKSFVTASSKPVSELNDKLRAEAMSFMNYQEELSNNDKINQTMVQFDLLRDFEVNGLYFNKSQTVKLTKLYTVSEILEAVTSTVYLVK